MKVFRFPHFIEPSVVGVRHDFPRNVSVSGVTGREFVSRHQRKRLTGTIGIPARAEWLGALSVIDEVTEGGALPIRIGIPDEYKTIRRKTGLNSAVPWVDDHSAANAVPWVDDHSAANGVSFSVFGTFDPYPYVSSWSESMVTVAGLCPNTSAFSSGERMRQAGAGGHTRALRAASSDTLGCAMLPVVDAGMLPLGAEIEAGFGVEIIARIISRPNLTADATTDEAATISIRQIFPDEIDETIEDIDLWPEA